MTSIKMGNKEEWLKSLKPGDKVAMITAHYISIQEVIRTTATQIILTIGFKFSINNGSEIGGDSWHLTTIEPVTEKIIQQLKHDSLKVKIGRVDLKSLSADKLEKILAIVEEKYI